MPKRKQRDSDLIGVILTGATISGAVLCFGYVLTRNVRFLENAWNFIKALDSDKLNSAWDSVLTSGNTGPVCAAVASPVVSLVGLHFLTLPKQRRLEEEKNSQLRLYAEMDGAYAEGQRSMVGEEKIAPNYPRALSAFKRARNLLSHIDFDEHGETFNEERIRHCVYNEAFAIYMLGLYDESEMSQLLNNIIRDDPQDREALNLQGLFYLKQEQFSKAMHAFGKSLAVLRSQNDVYVCWLYAKSQVERSTKYSNPIKKHLALPCSEKIFTLEMLHIKARLAFENKQYGEAISSAETALLHVPKNPGTYPEQIKLLNLLENTYRRLENALSENEFYEIESLARNGGSRRLKKQDIAAEIKNTQEHSNALKEELGFLSESHCTPR